MKRRALLQYASLSPLLFSTDLFAHAKRAPVLLLVELNGGNDSLNSFIPLDYIEQYHQLRPELGLQDEDMLQLDQQFAMHPSLQPLHECWRTGELALIHGLGYANPNRSHFRAIDIWDTASDSDQYLDDGWLSSIISDRGAAEVKSIVFGRNARAFYGQNSRFIQLKTVKQFLNHAADIESVDAAVDNPALRLLLNTQNSVKGADSLLRRQLKGAGSLARFFPDNKFGKQLADITSLIRSDLGVPVYKIALSGFDTHKSQSGKHAQLLKQLAQGLEAFKGQLESSGHWSDVLVMTYSEFGRRAAQNGSGGTDHGTAATHMVMGGRVRGGHYGEHPDLTQLEKNDMRFTTDFRRMYQTVISDWWQNDKLLGKGYQTLGFIKS
ncbi:DUF1501 domain-containing protein [Amphritea balenae]|nr:DUF1501 domain-containing protein [Amphritea balenae]GGK79294.1 hypothetical protein GCM10007941_31910 [Amphritea balenae]